MIARLLNAWLGEKGWSVWFHGGTYFAEFGWLKTDVRPGCRWEAGPMRRKAAQRLAANLRHKAENTPRDVM